MDQKLDSLLSDKNFTLIEIINIISVEDRWYSIQEISEKINLAERTVQRYINTIYDYAEEANEKEQLKNCFFIKRNKGIRLSSDNESSWREFILYVYEKDVTIQVLISLLFKHKDINKFSNERNLKVNTVKASIKNIRELISDLDLDVSIKKFSIIGNERQIRLLAFNVSWMLFNSKESPEIFDTIDKFKVDKAIKNLINSFHLDCHQTAAREISFKLMINILRFRLGNEVEFPEKFDKYIPTDSENFLNQTIFASYSEFHIQSQSEIHFFSLDLMIEPHLYKTPRLREMILSRYMENDLITETNVFMTEFNDKIISINEDQSEDIYIFIFRNFLFAKVYKHTDFNFNKPNYLSDMTINYSNYIHKINDFIDFMYTTTGNDIYEEKEFLMHVFFMVLSFVDKSSKLEKKINIYIETDFSFPYKYQLEQKLYSHFKDEFNLRFIKNPKIVTPDLILMNVKPIQIVGNFINISTPINNRDIINIRKNLNLILKLEI